MVKKNRKKMKIHLTNLYIIIYEVSLSLFNFKTPVAIIQLYICMIHLLCFIHISIEEDDDYREREGVVCFTNNIK